MACAYGRIIFNSFFSPLEEKAGMRGSAQKPNPCLSVA